MAWLRIVDLHKAIGEISQAISVLKMVRCGQQNKTKLHFLWAGCYVPSAQS